MRKGNLLKSRVSEIYVKQIRVNQGVHKISIPFNLKIKKPQKYLSLETRVKDFSIEKICRNQSFLRTWKKESKSADYLQFQI